MQIVRPLPDEPDLIIVYDLIDDNLRELCIRAYTSSIYYDWPEMTDDLRNALDTVPPAQDMFTYEYYIDKALNEIRNKTIKIMNSEYHDFKVERFQDFGKPSLRGPGSYMKPHMDGPPEFEQFDIPDPNIANLGANYYFNDNYEGGELWYPNLDFVYKPVPNSLVIHRGSMEKFRHGVKEVTQGWRFGFGMFSFEYYDLEPLEQGIDSDR